MRLERGIYIEERGGVQRLKSISTSTFTNKAKRERNDSFLTLLLI